MRLPGFALIAAALALSAAGCGSSSGKPRTLGALSYNDHGTKSAKAKSAFELEADSFYFDPTFVQGDPGKTLQLTVKNDSSATHNLSIASQGIDKDIPAKGSVTVTVTVPASGGVVFLCKYHTGQGMNGQILAGDAKPQALSSGPAPTTNPRPQSPAYPGY